MVSRSTDSSAISRRAYRNDLEIQLFGLQRSGNHAIVAWMLQQYDMPVVFLNNVKHFTDPFINFRFAEIANAIVLRQPKNDVAARKIEDLREAEKDLLVISFENLELRALADPGRRVSREEWVGTSRQIRKILLLRDFYNWIASRVRLFERRGQLSHNLGDMVLPHIHLWLIYAREYSGQTDFLGTQDVVRLAFNNWCGSETYRAYLLAELGLPHKDNSRSIIPDVGGGSSFDERRISAEAMPLLDRWKILREEKYRPVLTVINKFRTEIDTLNLQIFGLPAPL